MKEQEMLEEKEYLTIFSNTAKNIISNILVFLISIKDDFIDSINKIDCNNNKFTFISI